MPKAQPEDIVEKDIVTEEKKSQKKAEIEMPQAPEESWIDQDVDLVDTEKETETKEQIAPEVAAVHKDTETAQAINKKGTPKKVSKPKRSRAAKQTKTSVRSKKYTVSAQKFDRSKLYPLNEAVNLVKQASYSKFDGTVTLDLKLAKPKKGEDSIRGTIKLPHGTGKKLDVAIATDELIEKIKKGEDHFDILIATPATMPRLAQVAKILGPKGKMPNPKDGTVVDNPKAAQEELTLMARYRADLGRNLHIPVGKVSWESKKLEENVSAVLKALAHLKKESITLSPTMGPGIKIDYRQS